MWTKLPILHHSLVDPAIRERLDQDGLCGFSGTLSPPPSPSKLEKSLPALKEWGVTMDALVISPPPTDAEKKMIDRAGCEVRRFVERRWREDEWETAWFVNPPVSVLCAYSQVGNLTSGDRGRRACRGLPTSTCLRGGRRVKRGSLGGRLILSGRRGLD